MLDLHTYRLSLDETEILLYDEEPDDCVQEFKGKILRYSEPEEPLNGHFNQIAPKGQVIGTFEVYILDQGQAWDNGSDIIEAGDARSKSTAEYASAFYSENDQGFRAEIMEEFCPDGQNLLILERIAIHPEYRGQRLGLAVARRLIDLFGRGCGLVALKPFPLQHENLRPMEERSSYEVHHNGDLSTAQKQLTQYWKQLGLRRVKGTPYFALSLATQLPDIRKLASRRKKRT